MQTSKQADESCKNETPSVCSGVYLINTTKPTMVFYGLAVGNWCRLINWS